MFLQNLIGHKTSEDFLFQRLLFEVEARYDHYTSKYLQLILEKHNNGQIEVVELIKPTGEAEFEANIIKFIKKKDWVNISPYSEGLILSLCRKNLSTKSVLISTKTPNMILEGSFADPDISYPDLTVEEIKQGIYELCGIMEDHIENGLKPKKAM